MPDDLDAARGCFLWPLICFLVLVLVLLVVRARGADRAGWTPASSPAEVRPDAVAGPGQYAVAVWDAGCITTVEKTLKTRIEAPLKDGEPDQARAVILGLVVQLRPNCEHLEVRGKK